MFGLSVDWASAAMMAHSPAISIRSWIGPVDSTPPTLVTLTGVPSGISGTSSLARSVAYHSSENRSENTLSFRFLLSGFLMPSFSMFASMAFTAAKVAAYEPSGTHS